MNVIDEANILIKSWSGHLDAPTSELRVIEKLIIQLEDAENVIEHGRVLFFDKQEPEKSGVLKLSSMIKEYNESK